MTSVGDGRAAESIETQLEAIWLEHLADTIERIELIREVGLALQSGAGAATRCDEACACAHQLVGLGAAFGRPGVSELAREVEELLSGDAPTGDVGGQVAERGEQMLAIVRER